MSTLHHVCIRFVKTKVDPDRFTKAFDSVGNWARLNAFNWYVWSDLTSEQIYAALAPLINAEDNVAIFAIQPDTAAGWAPEWFWKWVRTQGKSGGPKI